MSSSFVNTLQLLSQCNKKLGDIALNNEIASLNDLITNYKSIKESLSKFVNKKSTHVATNVDYGNIGVKTISSLLMEIENDVKQNDNNTKTNDVPLGKYYGSEKIKSDLCTRYESLPDNTKEFIVAAVLFLSQRYIHLDNFTTCIEVVFVVFVFLFSFLCF